MVTTCRYCALFCPSVTTPIYGHCAGPFPPLFVDLKESYPFRDCPYKGDSREIDKVVMARGFADRKLKRIEYYAVSEEGIRTRYYSDLDKLKEDIRTHGLHYTLFVVFIDSDNIAFYRAVISQDLRGSIPNHAPGFACHIPGGNP